jgi:hypothetical protein
VWRGITRKTNGHDTSWECSATFKTFWRSQVSLGWQLIRSGWMTRMQLSIALSRHTKQQAQRPWGRNQFGKLEISKQAQAAEAQWMKLILGRAGQPASQPARPRPHKPCVPLENFKVPSTSCKTSDKLLRLSEPQFSHPCTWDGNSSFGSLKSHAESIAKSTQWQNTCLACAKQWLWSSAPQFK